MNFLHRKSQPVRLQKKESWNVRLNNWAMGNFGYLLLVTTILTLLAFIGVSFIIVGGSSLESGNYYNHLQDCACILHFTGGLL